MVEKTSPLDGLLKSGHHGRPANSDAPADLKISHRTCESLVQVTAWPKTGKGIVTTLEKMTHLSLEGGNSSPANEDFTIMPTGPGKYLIEAQSGDAIGQFQKKVLAEKGAVTDLTHARVVIRISGDQAMWVLAKGIAIDFSLQAFPVATSRNSAHHQIGLTIRRVNENAFDLFVFTSLARSFWHWLDRAAKEVGYEIVREIK